MRTTEVFVEQVLIGFMVLLIIGLPFIGLDQIGELLKAKGTDSIAKSIVVGTAVLGAAYLLGVVFNPGLFSSR